MCEIVLQMIKCTIKFLIKMEKNILRNFTTYEEQFKNTQICSSIRLNAEDQNEILNIINNTRNQKLTKVPTKRFQEYPLEGFEQNFLMSDHQNDILELIHSKSANTLRKTKDEKQLLQTKQKIGLQNPKSLYNTSSFDEMTMRMSMNKTNQNILQLHNLTNQTENQEKKLTKPQEMQIYNLTYTDNEMKIIIHEINRTPHQIHIQDDLPETQEQRVQREKKVSNFIKNQELLQNLRYSNTESSNAQSLQKILKSSEQQPYFKAALNTARTNRAIINYSPPSKESVDFLVKPKQQPKKPQMKLLVPRQPLSPASPQFVRPPGKKITLRDYIQLNILSSKTAQKDTGNPSFPGTPSYYSKTLRQGSFSKKKNPNSNNEVLSLIRSEIGSDLKLMQDNISILAEYFAGQEEEGEPEHSEVLRMYTISRMIKEKMLQANDEIVNYLQKK